MNLKGFFTKKRIIWTIIILLVLLPIGYQIFKAKDNSKNILTDTVKKQDLKTTVLATGQVVSSTDLSLSFKISGIVQRVNVKEGDKVKDGDVLATLSQSDAAASLTSAKGALAQAQANYEKVLAGASNEEIAVAQRAVDTAAVVLDNANTNLTITQRQQNTAVQNALSALLNSTITAIATPSNIGTATVTITGSFTGTDQGVYQVSVYSTGSGLKFQITGLETMEGDVKNTPVPMGNRGLFIQFSGSVYSSDSWTITIPNTVASNYVTNYNAYQAALQTQAAAVSSAQSQIANAKVSLDQYKASLDLKKAQARPADIDTAQAQILAAQGQVEAAAAALENTILRAPANGTITAVDVKVGEQATAQKEAVILQDVGSLHVEANVSEANIAQIKPEQGVDLTFDALGPDRHFGGKVQTVNPASTVISGVVNYLVKASMDNIPEVKPGMTANITVLVAQKSGALAVPQRAVIIQGEKKSVNLIDNPKKKIYHRVEVTTGLEADGGLVEITAGLSEGQEVVTYIKQ
jgi:HlyD family secretion protein